jgi:hypothetical protein
MSPILASQKHASRPETGGPLTIPGPTKDGRIPALDFTKGTLVFFMLLYHWINYLVGPQWPYYRYLRFLTPSFIFITGFMISNVYLSKYEAGDPRLAKRLLARGVKLIAIFVVLNILRDWVVPVLSTGGVVPDLLDSRILIMAFITGTFTSKVVAFFILIPIAYLLILAAALVVPLRILRYSFHVVCVCLFALIGMMGLSSRDNQIVEMVAIGMLGIVTGFSPIALINKVVRRPYLLMVSYVIYTLAIATWNVPYSLEVVGTYLSVMIIYLVGISDGRTNWVRDGFILLGKYSLFGYISQIVILQLLAAGFRHLYLGGAALIISFLAALALTVTAVVLVHRARSAPSIDMLYRAVFN